MNILKKNNVIELSISNPVKFSQFLSNPIKPVEILLNPLKSSQILLNPIKSYQILSNPLKSVQILPNPIKSYQILSNPMKSSQIHIKILITFFVFKMFIKILINSNYNYIFFQSFLSFFLIIFHFFQNIHQNSKF